MQHLLKAIKTGDVDAVKKYRKAVRPSDVTSGKTYPGEKYADTWKKYKATVEYQSAVNTLTNKTYAPHQPYVDNVIERIFMSGYWSAKDNSR